VKPSYTFKLKTSQSDGVSHNKTNFRALHRFI